MSDEKETKNLKIIFTPGCFDDFDGTQEELDALVREIHTKFESGELLEEAVPLDDISEEEMEDISDFLQKLSLDTPRKVH